MYEMNDYLDESNPVAGEESNVENETVSTEQVDQPEEESKELSLEEQLEGVEVESQEGESAPDILSLVNELGLIHNGLPYEYDNADMIKEHLMKGHDYTFKMQELAEQRKQSETELAEQREAFESEYQAFEQERQQVQGALTENEVMAEIFRELQVREPEFFQEISQDFARRMSVYEKSINNPHVKALESKINELEKTYGAKNQEAEQSKADGIVKAWEEGLKEVQTAQAPKLRALGVKPNWSEVQKVWQADATGQMTVKQAMLAVHGEEISKALEAKAKLAATKAKSSTRRGPEGISGQGETLKNNGDRYSLSAIEEIAAQHI